MAEQNKTQILPEILSYNEYSTKESIQNLENNILNIKKKFNPNNGKFIIYGHSLVLIRFTSMWPTSKIYLTKLRDYLNIDKKYDGLIKLLKLWRCYFNEKQEISMKEKTKKI